MCSGWSGRKADEISGVERLLAVRSANCHLAGDDKQTRFVLDLDKTIQFRAFTLADPYRVVLDIPQVTFQLAAGVGTAGRGLVKAFRYGLVMPGGSRIVFDLSGPARVANSYVLAAVNGQPPRLVLELEDKLKAELASAAQKIIQRLTESDKFIAEETISRREYPASYRVRPVEAQVTALREAFPALGGCIERLARNQVPEQAEA